VHWLNFFAKFSVTERTAGWVDLGGWLNGESYHVWNCRMEETCQYGKCVTLDGTWRLIDLSERKILQGGLSHGTSRPGQPWALVLVWMILVIVSKYWSHCPHAKIKDLNLMLINDVSPLWNRFWICAGLIGCSRKLWN